jgi:uncharacterized ferritin-like protein (DUF455 family)
MINLIQFLKCSKIDKRMNTIANSIREINLTLAEGTIPLFDSDMHKHVLPNKIVYPEGMKIVENDKDIKQTNSTPDQILHSIAHIEYNATTIYADTLFRFLNYFNQFEQQVKLEFIKDFIKIINDESTHFSLLNSRMIEQYGIKYGDYPVHNKLWSNAESTFDDFISRIVIISLVQESRGLDAGPRLSKKLKYLRDDKSVDLMDKIVNDEIVHVQIGVKWFKFLSTKQGCDNYEENFQRICKKYLKGPLFPPFNKILRDKAGIPETWYKF